MWGLRHGGIAVEKAGLHLERNPAAHGAWRCSNNTREVRLVTVISVPTTPNVTTDPSRVPAETWCRRVSPWCDPHPGPAGLIDAGITEVTRRSVRPAVPGAIAINGAAVEVALGDD